MMKKRCILFVLLIAIAPTVFASNLFLENDAIINEFKTDLKQRLQVAIKAGGPTNAINVCAKEAPKITAKISKKYGVKLQRLSDKNRNVGNRPNAIQKDIIDYFKQSPGASDVYYSELDGNKSIYARAIKTEGICLTCHGDSLNKKVKYSLKKQYPHDLATGYKLGDIRGVFSLERSLESGTSAGIKNFKVLSKGLWVGGKPSAANLQQLKELGVHKIVNLVRPNELTFDEEQVAKNLGVQYSHIPIHGGDDISLVNSQKLRAELNNASGPVFVHCASSNRVGALLALDASARGANLQQSLQLGRVGGMTSLEPVVLTLLEQQKDKQKDKQKK